MPSGAARLIEARRRTACSYANTSITQIVLILLLEPFTQIVLIAHRVHLAKMPPYAQSQIFFLRRRGIHAFIRKAMHSRQAPPSGTLAGVPSHPPSLLSAYGTICA